MKTSVIIEFWGSNPLYAMHLELCNCMTKNLSKRGLVRIIYFPLDTLYRDGKFCVARITINAENKAIFETKKKIVEEAVKKITTGMKFPVSEYLFILGQ